MERLFQEKVTKPFLLIIIQLWYKNLQPTQNILHTIRFYIQILELAHNKKSDHVLNLKSQFLEDDSSTMDSHYEYCVKLENELQYDQTDKKRDQELELCLEEIEKNLAKLR